MKNALILSALLTLGPVCFAQQTEKYPLGNYEELTDTKVCASHNDSANESVKRSVKSLLLILWFVNSERGGLQKAVNPQGWKRTPSM